MKKLMVGLGLLLCWSVMLLWSMGASAQGIPQKSFEGKVTYALSYVSRIPGASAGQIGMLMGTVQTYYTHGASYKYKVNGMVSEWAIYAAKEHRVYNKTRRTDTIKWYDVRVNHDTIYKTEVKKGDTTILGHLCDRVTFTCKSGVQVYYYSKDFWVDAALYADYKEVNYYAYLQIAHALALKEVFVLPDYTQIITAVAVEQEPVDEALFAIPQGVPVAEMNME